MRRPICTWWEIHAVAARLPRATGSVFGMNSGATQRADELAATDPVNRSQLGRRLELAAHSSPREMQVGAVFELDLLGRLIEGEQPLREGGPFGSKEAHG